MSQFSGFAKLSYFSSPTNRLYIWTKILQCQLLREIGWCLFNEWQLYTGHNQQYLFHLMSWWNSDSLLTLLPDVELSVTANWSENLIVTKQVEFINLTNGCQIVCSSVYLLIFSVSCTSTVYLFVCSFF